MERQDEVRKKVIKFSTNNKITFEKEFLLFTINLIFRLNASTNQILKN